MLRALRFLIIVGVVLLAACSGNQSPASPTAAPLTQAQPSSTGETFSVQVSGGVATTLVSGTDTSEFLKLQNGRSGYSLTFYNSDKTISVQIIFYTSTLPDAGTYPFSLDVVDGAVTAAVYRQDNDPLSFTLATGQITLSRSDNTYGGSFNFTSQGGKAGSLDQAVSVSGSFNKLSFKG
jgi:hypothetical protein